MTKKDFEVIAKVIARLERVEQPDASGRTHEINAAFVHQLFEEVLSEQHPRFDRGKFEAASLPIHTAELKRSILESLKQA